MGPLSHRACDHANERTAALVRAGSLITAEDAAWLGARGRRLLTLGTTAAGAVAMHWLVDRNVMNDVFAPPPPPAATLTSAIATQRVFPLLHTAHGSSVSDTVTNSVVAALNAGVTLGGLAGHRVGVTRYVAAMDASAQATRRLMQSATPHAAPYAAVAVTLAPLAIDFARQTLREEQHRDWTMQDLERLRRGDDPRRNGGALGNGFALASRIASANVRNVVVGATAMPLLQDLMLAIAERLGVAPSSTQALAIAAITPLVSYAAAEGIARLVRRRHRPEGAYRELVQWLRNGVVGVRDETWQRVADAYDGPLPSPMLLFDMRPEYNAVGDDEAIARLLDLVRAPTEMAKRVAAEEREKAARTQREAQERWETLRKLPGGWVVAKVYAGAESVGRLVRATKRAIAGAFEYSSDTVWRDMLALLLRYNGAAKRAPYVGAIQHQFMRFDAGVNQRAVDPFNSGDTKERRVLPNSDFDRAFRAGAAIYAVSSRRVLAFDERVRGAGNGPRLYRWYYAEGWADYFGADAGENDYRYVESASDLFYALVERAMIHDVRGPQHLVVYHAEVDKEKPERLLRPRIGAAYYQPVFENDAGRTLFYSTPLWRFEQAVRSLPLPLDEEVSQLLCTLARTVQGDLLGWKRSAWGALWGATTRRAFAFASTRPSDPFTALLQARGLTDAFPIAAMNVLLAAQLPGFEAALKEDELGSRVLLNLLVDRPADIAEPLFLLLDTLNVTAAMGGGEVAHYVTAWVNFFIDLAASLGWIVVVVARERPAAPDVDHLSWFFRHTQAGLLASPLVSPFRVAGQETRSTRYYYLLPRLTEADGTLRGPQRIVEENPLF